MAKKAGKTFSSGDLVFAKVRGYPPWPARVTASADKNSSKFHVFFYGTYETAVCKKEELWHYDDATKAKYGKNKSKMFPEAMDEMVNRPEIALAPAEPGTEPEEPQPPGPAGEPNLEPQTPTSTKAPPATDDDDSSDEKALVIDEDTKMESKAKSRGQKRKAEESPATPSQMPAAKQVKVKLTPLAEPAVTESVKATPATTMTTPATPTTSAALDEKTSRSGRLIKPRKFVDASPENSPPPHPPATTPKRDTPIAKVEYEIASKPSETKIKIVTKENRSPVAPAAPVTRTVTPKPVSPVRSPVVTVADKLNDKERFIAVKKEKIRWLRVEQRISDLDREIKASVHYQKPDMETCLKQLEELQTLAVTPFMFKKQPAIVQTMRMLTKYCGPAATSRDLQLNEHRAILSEAIRLEAGKILAKIRSLYKSRDGENFLESFEAEVAAFREATKDISPSRLLILVKDPTK